MPLLRNLRQKGIFSLPQTYLSAIIITEPDPFWHNPATIMQKLYIWMLGYCIILIYTRLCFYQKGLWHGILQNYLL